MRLFLMFMLFVSGQSQAQEAAGREVTLIVGRTWKHTVFFKKVPSKKGTLVFKADSVQKDMTMTASGSLLENKSFVADKDSLVTESPVFLTIEKSGAISLAGLMHKNMIHPALTGVQNDGELVIAKEQIQKDLEVTGALETPPSLIGKNFEGVTTEAEKLPVKVISDVVCKSNKDVLACTVTTESIDSGRFAMTETNQARMGELAKEFMAEKKRRQEAMQAARAQRAK